MGDICEMLAMQLTTQQAKLTRDTTSQRQNATDISIATANLLANDTGAPVPLTEASIGPRISALMGATPINWTLIGQYYGLLSLYYLANGWVMTIAQDNTDIANTLAAQVANGCP